MGNVEYPLQRVVSEEVRGGQTVLERLQDRYGALVVVHIGESPEGLGHLINEHFSRDEKEYNKLVIFTSSTDLARVLGRATEPKYGKQEGSDEPDPRGVVESELYPALQGMLDYTSLGTLFFDKISFQVGRLEVKLKTPETTMQH